MDKNIGKTYYLTLLGLRAHNAPFQIIQCAKIGLAHVP